jgi:valyl-tRNA synthetase
LLNIVSAALQRIRKAKSEAKLSMRAEVSRLVVRGDPRSLAQFRSAAGDIVAAGSVLEVVEEEATGAELTLDVML